MPKSESMKLLVVEDEKITADYLRRGLSEEGYTVDLATDAPSADEAVSVNRYDAVLLDAMLPGGDGFELCREWRARGLKVPVLFLTARDTIADRVQGLDTGADDYLVKPFAFEELLARVRALLRRPQTLSQDRLVAGPLELDLRRREVRLKGERLELSPREFQFLAHLMRAGSTVVTRTALWESVWETDLEPSSNVVDVYVGYLRKKLGSGAIRTVRGSGYKFCADAL